MPYIKQKTQTKATHKRTIIIAAACLLVVASSASALYVYKQHHPIVHTTASQNTKGEVAAPQPSTQADNSTTDSSPTGSTGTTQPGDSKSNTTTSGSGSASLIEPSGDFVSAHHISLSTGITSVCNTTSGATCSISFSSNGVTKSLAAQTTDRGGSTYWNNWTPKSIGLSAGTWKITATATLDGQSKSTSDATSLEVSE